MACPLSVQTTAFGLDRSGGRSRRLPRRLASKGASRAGAQLRRRRWPATPGVGGGDDDPPPLLPDQIELRRSAWRPAARGSADADLALVSRMTTPPSPPDSQLTRASTGLAVIFCRVHRRVIVAAGAAVEVVAVGAAVEVVGAASAEDHVGAAAAVDRLGRRGADDVVGEGRADDPSRSSGLRLRRRRRRGRRCRCRRSRRRRRGRGRRRARLRPAGKPAAPVSSPASKPGVTPVA